MSDHTTPPERTIVLTYELPEAAIDQWNKLPDSQLVNVPLTKHDLDQLMLGLRRMSIAQFGLGDAFAFFTRGELEEANKRFDFFKQTSRDGYSDINRFIESVMTKSVAGGASDG